MIKSRQMLCPCGYEFEYCTYYRGEAPLYLIDANILIYALRNDSNHGKACLTLVMSPGPFMLGTTETVLSEIKQELRELFTEKTVKQASLADLSLIQAACEHPEVQGLLRTMLILRILRPLVWSVRRKGGFLLVPLMRS